MRLTLTALTDTARAQLALATAQLLVWTRPRGALVGAGEACEAAATSRTPTQDVLVERLAVAVDRAARYGMFRPLCLVRAIALRRMLEARGIRGSAVRVGVRWDGRAFAAHAWVAFGDRPIAVRQGATSEYTPVRALRVDAGGAA
jgi:hypothetical protein